jgi:hypothetical protein
LSDTAIGVREPGFETVVSRLADVLVVQAVRAHVAQTGGGRKGWLRALVDPQIGRALSLIHERPEDDWTVESLASKVGMSRSAFAARFAQLVEEPPLTYLTRWRMQKASRCSRRAMPASPRSRSASAMTPRPRSPRRSSAGSAWRRGRIGGGRNRGETRSLARKRVALVARLWRRRAS